MKTKNTSEEMDNKINTNKIKRRNSKINSFFNEFSNIKQKLLQK